MPDTEIEMAKNGEFLREYGTEIPPLFILPSYINVYHGLSGCQWGTPGGR